MGVPGVRLRVYPRVCGGTRSARMLAETISGLSPRVRGNLTFRRVIMVFTGSIPACAGEPRTPASRCMSGRVYPRVCGGTMNTASQRLVKSGLSPRVRGNRAAGADEASRNGSIPACAGEPRRWAPGSRSRRVYPRVCGGTPRDRSQASKAAGLSPRVRGNHDRLVAAAREVGSIPACAGEPPPGRYLHSGSRVYPRVCGGTGKELANTRTVTGLSPRVRGNPRPSTAVSPGSGSIPACAGEPGSPATARMPTRVYPRVCGGTALGPDATGILRGLSPRVRGNLCMAGSSIVSARSIPACAGEPRPSPRPTDRARVYPRVCGGTGSAHTKGSRFPGLSPRVRGNPPRSCARRRR